jgi:SPP1 gp7 family putative phage head morphogenesis protein
MAVSARFDLPPVRAVSFFRQKGLDTSFSWMDMLREEHDAAFTVAKMMDLDLLRETRDVVDQALNEGWTFQQFRDRLKPELVRRGWWGRAEMPDPVTGEIRDVQLGSTRRLKVIFNTNLKTAYAAGHWSRIQEQAAEAPYLLYDAILDQRTRPQHAAWDGTVLPVDSPWWATHYPPNGWNCRCSVIQLDADQLRELGKAGPDDPPPGGSREWVNPRTGEVEEIPTGIDPGWNYHPGRSRTDELGEQMREKATAAGPDLGQPARQAAAEKRLPTLDEAIAEGHRRIQGHLDALDGTATGALAFRENLLAELREHRGMDRQAKLANRGKGADLVRTASQKYPDEWVRRADELGELRARAQKARGFQLTIPQSHDGKRMRLPGGFGARTLKAGEGYLVADDHRVAVHEYGHRLQHADPVLDDYFQQLHERRTAGQPIRKLSALTGRPFPGSEVAQEDDYLHAYMGKVYSMGGDFYSGRAGALEVLPMAYEMLFERDPQGLVEGDPELAALAVGLLYRY